VPLCLIATYSVFLKIYCLHVYNYFVINLPGCNIYINIYFPSSVNRTQHTEDFILYKYIPADSADPTVEGVGCSPKFSEIAGSSPTEGMLIILLCFLRVVCCVGSGLCVELTLDQRSPTPCVCV
jgi:hypothetical protein